MRLRSTSDSLRTRPSTPNNFLLFSARCGKIPERVSRNSFLVAWRSGSASALQALGRGFKSLSDHQVFKSHRFPVAFFFASSRGGTLLTRASALRNVLDCCWILAIFRVKLVESAGTSPLLGGCFCAGARRVAGSFPVLFR